MGLFNSLKKNFKHGGVKIQLQAPDTIGLPDAALPVTVTVTATDGPAQINSIKAEIIATSFDRSFSQPIGPTNPNYGQNMGMGVPETVAQAVNPQGFSLAAGQSQTIQLDISMNPSGQPMSENLQKVEAVTQFFNPTKYVYSVNVSADVEGITLDPSASQKLKIKGASSPGIGSVTL